MNAVCNKLILLWNVNVQAYFLDHFIYWDILIFYITVILYLFAGGYKWPFLPVGSWCLYCVLLSRWQWHYSALVRILAVPWANRWISYIIIDICPNITLYIYDTTLFVSVEIIQTDVFSQSSVVRRHKISVILLIRSDVKSFKFCRIFTYISWRNSFFCWFLQTTKSKCEKSI